MVRFRQLLIVLLAACLLCASGCGPTALPTQKIQSPVRTPEPTPLPVPTTTPTPTVFVEETPNEPADGLQELQLGSRGPMVEKLQLRLIELGYLQRENPDDYFDIVVEGAVKIFQKAADIEPTGVAGIATLTRLFETSAPPKESAFPYTDPYNPGAAGMDITLDRTLAPDETPVTVTEPPQSTVQSGSFGILRIGLDPGHQAKGNSAQEPIAPGSSQKKAKVTSGTSGTATGQEEHAVNLAIALKVRDLLQAQNVDVMMTRESGDVDISNSERATKMNEAGADLVVRLHCNGDSDSSRAGAFILIPSGSYTTAIQSESKAAAEDVLAAFIDATGAKNLGLSERSDQTGFNWSTVPVINIEMGHLSNAAEDQLLATEDYRNKCAQGIAQGILNHFR